VVVPIYFRESPERIEYIVGHAGVRAVIIAGDEQIAKFEAIRDRLPGVEHVIVAGASPREFPADTLRYEEIVAGATAAGLDSYRRCAAQVQPDQLASIIYTSGTTGEPKGVMLSHANFVSNQIASFENFPLSADDLAVSVLPLAHVYERLVDYGY